MKNDQTTHSEYGKIKSIFIKKVEDAFVNENAINQQWESLNYLGKPDFKKAIEEYTTFENLLRQEGTNIYYIPDNEQVGMDSMYCRDASIATDKGMILCNMGKEQRKNEPYVEASFFEKNGLNILGKIESPGTVEGGDVAWLDSKTLAIGHGISNE